MILLKVKMEIGDSFKVKMEIGDSSKSEDGDR